MPDSFRITPLSLTAFAGLIGQPDAALAARGVRRLSADAAPGYPCRVSLVDASLGESVLLLSHVHLDVQTPYRGVGPIYVREGASEAAPDVGEVPESVRRRMLSFRAYDGHGMMRASEVADGRDLEAIVSLLLADEAVEYLHLHNAKPGCYSCRIDRA